MEPLNIEVIYLNDKLPNPERATEWSAAFDLYANIDESIVVKPGESVLMGTGVQLNMLSPDICATVLPRSGLGHKNGIVMGNLIGLIDADYQGEVKIPVWNRNSNVKWVDMAGPNGTMRQTPVYNQEGEFTINPGDRIVQLMFVRPIHPTMVSVKEFSTLTGRGEGGFGHSGGSALLGK